MFNFGFNNTEQQPIAPLQSNAITAQGQAPVAPGIDPGGYTAVAPNLPAGQGGSFFRNANGSFNTGNGKLALGAIQTLGSLWNSFQQQKLAKDTYKFNKQVYQTNLDNQTSTYNTALEDRIRARYATEGRSDQADSYIEKHKL